MKITFIGATQSVTGSCHLVETGRTRILIDCGLYQGQNFVAEENYAPFPFDPKSIDYLVVTHAHLDHIGRIPKLLHDGFKGVIFGTPPTRALADLSLKDSVGILCKEAERAGKKALCEMFDPTQLLSHWKDVRYGETVAAGDARLTFYNAGHILGSAFVLVEAEGKRIVFSGDLGNVNQPLLPDGDTLPEADALVLESTYGDRLHENLEKRTEMLEHIVQETAQKQGVLLIPAFAVERTQEIIVEMDELLKQKKVPPIQIYLDSSLAIDAIVVYEEYQSYLKEQLRGTKLFSFRNLTMTKTHEESLTIANKPDPKIIIAGSGMSHGGRIMRHERMYLGRESTTLLVVGYQAEGSLGRQIVDGAQEVQIEGERVQVKATVETIYSYSAHPDKAELLRFVYPQKDALKKIFLVHGESAAKDALRSALVDYLGVEVEIPETNQSVTL